MRFTHFFFFLLNSLYYSYRSVCTLNDLQGIGEQLTEPFKAPITEEIVRQLEYEFHSANHTIMSEVAVGLQTVTGHLIKTIDEFENDINVLKIKSIAQFLLFLFKNKDNYITAFNEIGIQNAQPSHLSCLADISISVTFNCLKLFVKWLDEERYNFCSLPFPLKVHMTPQDEASILNIHQSWKGNIVDLMECLHQLMEVLKHSESDITKKVKEFADVSA